MNQQISHEDTFDLISPIAWNDGLQLLEQTLLPEQEVWLDCPTPEIVADAIRRLAVRGAPAIGVAAAYGLVVGLRTAAPGQSLANRFDEVYELLASTRPTAVNLRWALDRGRQIFDQSQLEPHDPQNAPQTVIDALLDWAKAVHTADVEANRNIGSYGSPLFEPGDRVLTHCNAGALATAGYGTAVGVITSGFRDGRIGHVWVDETRPLLQGARLTAWELEKLGVPYRLVTDSSVGALMSRGLVDRVVVGADRIAANGDVANKIGTYTVAVLANRHQVPFYVAAPRSTLDPHTPTGADIPIEERASDEVTHVGSQRLAPTQTVAHNFAFDVTPNELVAGIVTEVGVLRAPYTDSIAAALAA